MKDFPVLLVSLESLGRLESQDKRVNLESEWVRNAYCSTVENVVTPKVTLKFGGR